jgi:PKD repeat protein
MTMKTSLTTMTLGLVALAAAGASCNDREIEVSELRVELPEPYAPVSALVAGQVILPTQTGGDISAKVNFGDGTSTNVDISAQGRFSAGHTYANAGNFEVLVEVESANGGSGSRSTVARIAAPLSTPEFECVSCDGAGVCNVIPCEGLGQRVSFRGSVAGGIGAKRFRWDFGDGRPQQDGTVVTHEYATAGTYSVTMLAADSISSTAFSTRDVVVTQVQAAVIVADGPTGTVAFGNPAEVSFYGAGVPPMRVFTSWGDGSSSVVNNYTADGSDATVSHVYMAGGTYTVTLDAVDALGQQAQTTVTVRYANAPATASSSSAGSSSAAGASSSAAQASSAAAPSSAAGQSSSAAGQSSSAAAASSSAEAASSSAAPASSAAGESSSASAAPGSSSAAPASSGTEASSAQGASSTDGASSTGSASSN